MQSRREMMLLIAGSVASITLGGPTIAVAQQRYNFLGEEIEAVEWLDDSEGDLYQYFVEKQSKYLGPWQSEEEIEVFLDRFNQLVRHRIFDDLDCRIVWNRKFGASPTEIYKAIVSLKRYENLTEAAYYKRIEKIRFHMRIAYGHRD